MYENWNHPKYNEKAKLPAPAVTLLKLAQLPIILTLKSAQTAIRSTPASRNG